jgi:hypothetical protein
MSESTATSATPTAAPAKAPAASSSSSGEKSSCGCAGASGTTGGQAGLQNGKGDAPRNVSEKFRRNYDEINWGR